MPQDPPNQVTIFADTFVAGPIAGEIKQEVAMPERQANVLSVRNVKEFADFSVFSMPLPPAIDGEHSQRDHQPSKHVIDLAHEMVDNGMDVFVGHGGHVMQGVEIYKGRPIFYSMGDLSLHRSTRTTPENLVAFVATSTYQDGILQEIRIHPLDLGLDSTRPASRLGIPMTPSPEVRAKILADLQKYSKPLGTEILIEGSVGVIRVSKAATTAIGQGIREFGPPATSVLQGGGGRGGRGGRGPGPSPF